MCGNPPTRKDVVNELQPCFTLCVKVVLDDCTEFKYAQGVKWMFSLATKTLSKKPDISESLNAKAIKKMFKRFPPK